MVEARIFILYTGGTIGMAPKDPRNPESPLVPKSLEELRTYMPAVAEFENRIDFGEESPFDPPLDSSDVKPEHWKKMAECIERVYDDYDGFIVLHGTDTMAYTASALSFIFENLSKPIIVTGSQLPPSDPRTDAILNFTNAIYLAGYKVFDLPPIPEVVICFSDKILRGNRTTKVSSTELAGFDSPHFPPLGTLGEHIKINTKLLLDHPKDKKCVINTDLVDRIMSVVIFPGFEANDLRKLINDEDIKGVIINTFGAGNVPSDEDLLDVISTATRKGKIILNISQVVQGMVEMGLYEASSGLLERGVASGLDMTTEAALAKFMWILGASTEHERITQLQINQRGEQTENLLDLRYGSLMKEKATSIDTKGKVPDSKLNRDRLAKAVLRFSNLGLTGAKEGERIQLNVFMNKPLANHSTPESDVRCVASIGITWENKPQNPIQEITGKAKHVIGDRDIALTIVSPNEDVKFYYDGLYLALFWTA